MLFRAGRSKLLVLLSAWVTILVVDVFSAGFPVRGRRWGCRSFLRRGVRHEAVRRATVGRDQSGGATSPDSGVMTCTIRADRETVCSRRAGCAVQGAHVVVAQCVEDELELFSGRGHRADVAVAAAMSHVFADGTDAGGVG